jgi:hypothetical protein
MDGSEVGQRCAKWSMIVDLYLAFELVHRDVGLSAAVAKRDQNSVLQYGNPRNGFIQLRYG